MSGHSDALAPLSRNGALMSSASIGHNGFNTRCVVVQLRELSLGELDGYYSSDSFNENDPASRFSCSNFFDTCLMLQSVECMCLQRSGLYSLLRRIGLFVHSKSGFVWHLVHILTLKID